MTEPRNGLRPLLAALLLLAACSPSGTRNKMVLTPGQKQRVDWARDHLHRYTFTAPQGALITLKASQHNSDLAIEVTPPGQRPIPMDGYNFWFGDEELMIDASTGGTFQVAIRRLDQRQGAYTLTLDLEERPSPNALAAARIMCAWCREKDPDPQARLEEMISRADSLDMPRLSGHLHADLARELGKTGKCEAVDHMLRAVNLYRVDGDAVSAAFALRNLALYLRTCQPGLAGDAYERALGQAELAGDLALQAFILRQHAWELHYQRGSYQQAIHLLEDAGRRAEQAGALDQLAGTLEDRGSCYNAVKRIALGRSLHQRAIGLWDDLNQPERRLQVQVELAWGYHVEGDDASAIPLLREAIDKARKLKNNRIRRGASDRLGSAYRTAGRYEEAERAFSTALQLSGESDSVERAHVYANLATLYLDWGRPKRALEQAKAAWDIFQSREMHLNLAQIEYLVARARDQMGNRAEALAQIESATHNLLSIRGRQTQINQGRFFTDAHYDNVALYIRLLMEAWQNGEGESYQQKALALLERVRGQVLNERLRQRYFRQAVPAQLARKAAAARNHVDDLERRRVLGERADRQLVEALTQAERLESEIGSFVSGLNRQQVPIDLRVVQKELLDKDSLLLVYSVNQSAAYLWAVSPEFCKAFTLADANLLEARVSGLLELAANPLESQSSQVHHLAEALSRQLLTPVAPLIRNKRLMVVKDGSLHGLPFALMPDPNQAGYMSEHHGLTVLPSAAHGVRLRQSAAAHGPRDDRALVLADPVYEADDPRLKPGTPPAPLPDHLTRAMEGLGMQRLVRLEASGREAQALKRLLPADSVDHYLGFQAHIGRILGADLSTYRWIHLAGHGLLHPRHPELSCMVFSRYDERGEPRPAALRGHQLAHLDLNADLVTLSGCKTARGTMFRGEGPWSLAHDLLGAGTSGVLVSLWNVHDQATAELMTVFYEGLLGQGLDPDRALCRAQDHMRHHPLYSEPYFWAGWVLQGIGWQSGEKKI